MPDFVFTESQVASLKNFGEKFSEWVNTQAGRTLIEARREKVALFRSLLSQDNIDKLSESDFMQLYRALWAGNVFKNKDYIPRDQILRKFGIALVRQELTKLLYGKANFTERYNEFKRNIKHMRMATVSEILAFTFPDKYCLWNEKPKTVLPALRLDVLPQQFFSNQLQKGEDYELCIRFMTHLKDQVEDYKIKDFIDLDAFMYFIFDSLDRNKIPPPQSGVIAARSSDSVTINSHESAEYYLLDLGRMLGHQTYTVDGTKSHEGKRLEDIAILKDIPSFASERDLRSAREIDVIWFNEDGNPDVCFEVENSTNILTGLNRFYQIKQIRSKFFIVAPEDKRSKFKIEMGKSPFRTMQDLIHFISYDELAQLYAATVPSYELRRKYLRE